MQNTLLQSFTPSQADDIITAAGTPEYKQKLADITKMVVEEQGAFGCPWFWVSNREGRAEPFFGSDRYFHLPYQWAVHRLILRPVLSLSRFHFMWDFLGLPWDDIKLLSHEASTASTARL